MDRKPTASLSRIIGYELLCIETDFLGQVLPGNSEPRHVIGTTFGMHANIRIHTLPTQPGV